jgi:hypothetical protein
MRLLILTTKAILVQWAVYVKFRPTACFIALRLGVEEG